MKMKNSTSLVTPKGKIHHHQEWELCAVDSFLQTREQVVL